MEYCSKLQNFWLSTFFSKIAIILPKSKNSRFTRKISKIASKLSFLTTYQFFCYILNKKTWNNAQNSSLNKFPRFFLKKFFLGSPRFFISKSWFSFGWFCLLSPILLLKKLKVIGIIYFALIFYFPRFFLKIFSIPRLLAKHSQNYSQFTRKIHTARLWE